VDAVLELDRAHGGSLSKGALVEARIELGAEAGLTLVVKQGCGSAATEVQRRYALTEVAAAAIHYCARARIPLPRNSTKSIGVGPEGFHLTIEVPTEVARLHGALPEGSARSAGMGAEVSSEPAAEPWDESEEEGAAIEASGAAALDDPTSPQGAAEIAA